MELEVYHRDGSATGRAVALDATVFGMQPNDHVLWLDVRRTQASSRQGTHQTKERGDVAGSMRKLYRQKGTGMARSGTAKSPLRRSGGRIFGPHPRSYSLRLGKKTRRLARRSALSYKARIDAIRVVEPLNFDGPSTHGLLAVLGALNISERRVLLITAQHEPNAYLSSRNTPGLVIREARNVSTEDILRAGTLLLEEDALQGLVSVLSSTNETATS